MTPASEDHRPASRELVVVPQRARREARHVLLEVEDRAVRVVARVVGRARDEPEALARVHFEGHTIRRLVQKAAAVDEVHAPAGEVQVDVALHRHRRRVRAPALARRVLRVDEAAHGQPQRVCYTGSHAVVVAQRRRSEPLQLLRLQQLLARRKRVAVLPEAVKLLVQGTRVGPRRFTSRHETGMMSSRKSSLLRAVTSTFKLRKALLRCKLLSARGKLESPTLIRNREQETPLLGSRVAINGLVAKPELNGRTGTVVSFDDAKGRYCLELEGTSSSLMIKPCNLLLTVCSVALCSLLFSHVQTLPRLS